MSCSKFWQIKVVLVVALEMENRRLVFRHKGECFSNGDGSLNGSGMGGWICLAVNFNYNFLYQVILKNDISSFR
jgi:hypothetical protein